MIKQFSIQQFSKGRSLFLICLLLFLSESCFTQKHNILNFSTRDGLSSQIVNDVFQDTDGYIWFATQSGVSLFNGHEFTDFAPLKEMIGVDAVSVIQDQSGRICIGTNTNGLFIYDYKTTLNFKVGNGLPTNVIRKLFVDSTGVLWVLTAKGVYQLIQNKLVEYKDPDGIFKNGVLSMTQTKNGDFWFGTQGKGLVQSSKGKFHYFVATDGILDDYIFSLSSYGDSLLIGTTNQGVILAYNSKFKQLPIKEIQTAWISAILPNPNGLHIISSNGLVNYQKNGSYELITEKNGLATNDLYNGYFDRENNLWLTSGNGVSCLRKEEIISLDEETGLSDEKITCVYQLANGRIIAGTYGAGLNLIQKNGEIIKKILPPELVNVKVTCLFEIPERNELWIGTEQSNSGIIILNTHNDKYAVKKTIQKIDNVFIQTVTRIDQDQNKHIWVGTFNAGLFRLSESDTLNYNSSNILPSNEVYTFLLDKRGNPWVSIYQKGLFRFKNNAFTQIYHKDKLNDKFILSLEEDPQGTIYIGTKSKGITVFENGVFHQITKKDGLLSNSIQALIYKNGQLWVGTNRGINLLKKISDSDYYVITYDQRSGLTNVEIQQNALIEAEDAIWIGSTTGLSRIKLSETKRQNIKPFIELKTVKLFYKNIDWSTKDGSSLNKRGVPTKLNLKYTENHLTFEYGALTTSSVFYTYFLEGEDKGWSPLTDKREVTFSNLSPGNYVFKVKSVDNFGVESDVLSIPITINSPFWQMWWFRISLVLLIAILIILFIRLRERNYREEQRILEQMVQDRTREVVQASALVEVKNKEILDSITYAKRIQTAMLPSKGLLQKEFDKIVIFYQPKDIVAGDFYWFEKVNTKKIIAVADCTGHGVPGAMISVVCNNALNRSIREYGIQKPAKLLDKTRELILDEFSKNQEDMKDGMDISLALFDPETLILEWAGANIPLWILRKDATEITEIRGDKQPIGMHINNHPYTNHSIQLAKGDSFYLLTDGFSDQFGGEKGKKLKSAQLKKIILSLSQHPHANHEAQLKSAFEAWRGQQEQVDDVCLISIRV